MSSNAHRVVLDLTLSAVGAIGVAAVIGQFNKDEAAQAWSLAGCGLDIGWGLLLMLYPLIVRTLSRGEKPSTAVCYGTPFLVVATVFFEGYSELWE